MSSRKTFLVFGATGGTGRHLVDLVLGEGHLVRAVARQIQKLPSRPGLTAHQGTLPGVPHLDSVLDGVDFVVAMVGDAGQQQHRQINTEFVRALVPAMRQQGVQRFLYQAGGLSASPGRKLSPELRVIRTTIARSYKGQHEDNEAVMRYLTDEADDIEWMVHRAGIGSRSGTAGTLTRSENKYSVATFHDVAAYNLRLLTDASAVHTCDFSTYRNP